MVGDGNVGYSLGDVGCGFGVVLGYWGVRGV